MNILSLFDWMSCWMLALQRAWIKVDNYFASEIDKYAIQVSEKNFPEIVQLWDVRDIEIDTSSWYLYLDWWEEYWTADQYHKIDLLIGGSPCQWFSFAGKQLNFEDPRSKLFFDYVRILKEVKPKYFLLENVNMKKEYQDIISENLFWVQPIEINSALVSAQNRRRLYRVWERQDDWTYKQVQIQQPEDKWILLKDILEESVDDKYYLSDEVFQKLKKFESNARLSDIEWKSYCLNTMQWWHRQPKIIQPCAMRWRYIVDGKRVDEVWAKTEQRIEIGQDQKAHTITSVQKDSMIIQKSHGFNKWWEHKDKSPTMTSNSRQENNHLSDWVSIRKLTPVECERLQTVPDWYTSIVSNSQRYKMLGNWRTVDVLAYIFSYLK